MQRRTKANLMNRMAELEGTRLSSRELNRGTFSLMNVDDEEFDQNQGRGGNYQVFRGDSLEALEAWDESEMDDVEDANENFQEEYSNQEREIQNAQATKRVEGRKIVTVKDVEPEKFISAFSQHLKRQGRFELPKWADVVKTSKARELPPSDPDWLYVRTASMVRKIYIRKGMGVGAFRKVYGSQQRRGTCTNVFTKSSGKIARYILQQLEEMGLVEQDEEGGRMITKDRASFDALTTRLNKHWNRPLKRRQMRRTEKIEEEHQKRCTEHMRIKMECIYPIHVAAQLNDTYTMRILLDMRVDPQTGASGGRTAMDVAQEADQDGSHAPVLRLLLLSEHVKSDIFATVLLFPASIYAASRHLRGDTWRPKASPEEVSHGFRCSSEPSGIVGQDRIELRVVGNTPHIDLSGWLS
eukprot:g32274.t1